MNPSYGVLLMMGLIAVVVWTVALLDWNTRRLDKRMRNDKPSSGS